MSSSSSSEFQNRLGAYEREVSELQESVKSLEEEIISLRRKLADAPKRVRSLEEKLLEVSGELNRAVSQNEKLTSTLREAREHIANLREEVEKLTQAPNNYGTFLSRNEDGTCDIYTSGRKMRVNVHPGLTDDDIERGQEVVLNESMNIVLVRPNDGAGEVVTLTC
jgi:proteasome-associated ATPase